MAKDVTVIDVSGTIARHKQAFTWLGMALIVAGALAIAFPLLGGFAVEFWIAAACGLAGLAQIIHALSTRDWHGLLWGLIIGALYLAVAVGLLANPARGLVTLTALLSGLLVAEGVIQAMMGLRLRPLGGALLMILSGFIGIAAGFYVFHELPSTAGWVLGTLLGANFIISGVACIALARHAVPALSGAGQQAAKPSLHV